MSLSFVGITVIVKVHYSNIRPNHTACYLLATRDSYGNLYLTQYGLCVTEGPLSHWHIDRRSNGSAKRCNNIVGFSDLYFREIMDTSSNKHSPAQTHRLFGPQDPESIGQLLKILDNCGNHRQNGISTIWGEGACEIGPFFIAFVAHYHLGDERRINRLVLAQPIEDNLSQETSRYSCGILKSSNTTTFRLPKRTEAI